MTGTLLKMTGIGLILSVLLWQSAIYIQTQIFTFPEEKPFTGLSLVNPYTGLSTPTWYKANFHGHARVWGGLTNGKQPGDSVLAHYLKMGYDIPVLSNYHQIDEATYNYAPVRIPAYEHGYNLMKSHRLVIGSSAVDFFDFPLGHLASHQQQLLNRLYHSAPVVVIAHPKFQESHSRDRLRLLTGYHCLEVLNHYRISEDHWDAALSAGREVWLIANDDTHDITDPGETGVCWTMVASNTQLPDSVYAALKTGRTVGVKGKQGVMDNQLKSVTVANQTVSIQLDREAQKIEWIGQHGALRETDLNTATGNYSFSDADTYIRARVTNETTVFYLNPVFRSETGLLTGNQPAATENILLSIGFRLGVALINGLVFYILLGRNWIRLAVLRKRSGAIRQLTEPG